MLFLVAVASLKAQQFSKDNFLLGDKVRTENEEYYLLMDVLAKIGNVDTQQQATGQPLGLGIGERILKQKHIYQIYQTVSEKVYNTMQDSTKQFARAQSAISGNNGIQATNKENNFLVAWNDRTKDFAIVTGSIIIQLKDFSYTNDLISDYNLLETHRFPNLNNLLIVKSSLKELVKTVKNLQVDARVQVAKLEILEDFQVPQ